MITVDWITFKDAVTSGGMPWKYHLLNNSYHIIAADGPFALFCQIMISDDSPSSDQVDFEANWKSKAAITLNQFDTDGAMIVRNKAAKRGWSFWAIPIEITTATLGGSLHCKNSADVDIPGLSCKIYDGSNQEITVPGLADVNLTTCTKTVIDFEPTFDYEIVGGALRISANPGDDIRMWIIGAPDIPAAYGGSKEFASGINLKFLMPDSTFDIDGRVAKYITYNPVTHQGKLRILLRHPAGSQVNMQFVIHMFRA